MNSSLTCKNIKEIMAKWAQILKEKSESSSNSVHLFHALAKVPN